ncbi:metal-dependent transcriptional regulator [Portibacter lacus]|uniref:Transcriptional regulator MntR n=1 Tax=Portibacter lacus TaxID=1099794 RepID=A0AA37WFE1_9BACT|nr:metal-dependent transcriptional regulator [Portibacter lacus]GLR17564.1 iron-dependent repressor [Portibacter lacus]
MPTQTKENYLKAIYFLDQNNSEVTLTALGKLMEVSTPTVNNMVKKLATKGWVNYEKYKPLTLTDLGKKDAALIVRKHRLTEMFLVQIMGFGWEEVHEIAEEMEHLNSEVLFDRMDLILGNPTQDPHGSPIPDKDGNFTRKKYLKLSDLRQGDVAYLRAVGDSSAELLLLLNAKNIKLGTQLQVAEIESYDKSMVVRIENSSNSTFSYEVCKRLLVEKI